jgi:hypothetical protein
MKLVIVENGETPIADVPSGDHDDLGAHAAALCGLSFLQGLPIQKGEVTPERQERARRLAERFSLFRP